VKAISDLVGADYSAKYSVSSFVRIEYNTEEYAPSSSMKGKGASMSDKKYFDKSKGYSGKRFSQAVFGFKKSIIPSAKLRKGGARVNSHLFPLFAITTTGWAGKDEMTCILRFWQAASRGLMKPPGVLKSLVENLKEDNGKATPLGPEDQNGYSEPIKFLAGLVKAAVDFMEVAEANLTGEAATERVQAESESPGGGDRWAPAPDEATAEAAGGQHVLG
jgi:hypothetical protein